MENAAELSARVGQYVWFHSIDLGNGVVTPGVKPPEIHGAESRVFFDPIKMQGVSILDIGAWNGYYSFESKRRGAARVLASDHFCWNDPTFRGKETFDLAREALGYTDIETVDIDVPQLSVERLGTFDVVLFLGVFYHLFDPIDGLRRAASLAKEVLVVETHVDLQDLDRPAMAMYPGKELANDPTNWWGPNSLAMIGLLSQLGFKFLEERRHPLNETRRIFHAWRSRTLQALPQ